MKDASTSYTFIRLKEFLRKDRGLSAEKQTPKTGAHVRSWKRTEKTEDTECSYVLHNSFEER